MTSPAPAPPRTGPRPYGFIALAAVVVLLPLGWLTTHIGATAAVPTARIGATAAAPTTRLAFRDDFTGPPGSRVDPANWAYALGHGYPGGAANWGTGEIEEMTDRAENAALDGAGNLAITPRRDAAGGWTSARIETRRTDFAAPPGGRLRIEGRLRQPAVAGAAATGYWPAFWTLGEAARPVGAANWPGIGEWDVMESVNGRRSVFQTLHCGVAPGGPCNENTGIGSGERPLRGSPTSFHTYAVEYDRGTSPEELRWSVDGRTTFTVRADRMDATTWNNATRHGMFVILNVAMGGSFPAAYGGGLPTSRTKPGVPMLVDYVAVYLTGGR